MTEQGLFPAPASHNPGSIPPPAYACSNKHHQRVSLSARVSQQPFRFQLYRSASTVDACTPCYCSACLRLSPPLSSSRRRNRRPQQQVKWRSGSAITGPSLIYLCVVRNRTPGKAYTSAVSVARIVKVPVRLPTDVNTAHSVKGMEILRSLFFGLCAFCQGNILWWIPVRTTVTAS